MELAKRDFKKKYKRTVLGMLWSLLFPLLQLTVMALIFTKFFGNQTEYFVVYLFAGNLVFNFFKESTNGGMVALTNNGGIITKINVPKYLFLLSKNVSALINFVLSLAIFLIFCIIYGPGLHIRFLMLIYPIITLLVFNIGVGLILSAMFVFFKDMQYLYDIFTLLLMYLSAIFYPITRFEPAMQKIFMLNPVYAHIQYFRLIAIYQTVPSLNIHLLCAFYALAALFVGAWIYKKQNYRFVYYM